MKRYTKNDNYWYTGKALTFFDNFIRNHRGPLSSNDVFDIVAGLMPPEELQKLITSSFPAFIPPGLAIASAPPEIMQELVTENSMPLTSLVPSTITAAEPLAPNVAFAPGIQFVAAPIPSIQLASVEFQLAPAEPFQTRFGVTMPSNTSSCTPPHHWSLFSVMVKR